MRLLFDFVSLSYHHVVFFTENAEPLSQHIYDSYEQWNAMTAFYVTFRQMSNVYIPVF